MTWRLVALWVAAGGAGLAADDPPAKPQWERVLIGDDAKSAADLERQLADALKADRTDEALKLAEELVALRKRAQGVDHWQVRNAEHKVAYLTRSRALTPEQRGQLNAAERLATDVMTLYEQAKYGEAVPLAEKAHKLFQEVLGDAHPLTAKGVNRVAMLYLAQGRYRDAEPLLRESWQVTRAAAGPSHPDALAMANNLAQAHDSGGRYADAEAMYREALTGLRSIYGPAHRDVLTVMNNLAHAQKAQGRYAEAEAVYRGVLSALGTMPGDTQLVAEVVRNNLAVVCQDQGRYVEAEQLYQDALRSLRSAVGEAHPYVAMTLNNLAELYRDQGRHADAEPLYQDALRTLRAVFGERRPQVATVLNNLALLYHASGAYAQAEAMHRQALEVRTAVYGDAHPDTAMSLHNLAGLLLDKWRYDEAEPLYRQAVRVRAAALGDAHPDTARSRNGLAGVYAGVGRYADAGRLYRDALGSIRASLGDAHPNATTGWINVAASHTLGGSPSEAVAVLREAVRSYEASRLARAAGPERGVGAADINPYQPMAAVAVRLGRAADAYQAVEADAARGLLDEVASRRGAGLTPDERSTRAAAADRLAAVDARLLRLATQPKLTDPERAERDALAAERGRLTDTLAALAAAVSRREVADLAAIRQAIPADAALVAWVDVTNHNARVQEHWGCVVRRTADPKWERLSGTGPGGQWSGPAEPGRLGPDDKLPAAFRQAVASAAPAAEVEKLRQQVHAQRIAPLLKHLDGVKTLYIVPVRAMAGVPVEPLVPDLTVHYVPSGTFLARLNTRPPAAGRGLLAVGDPQYPPPAGPSPARPLPPSGLLVALVVPGGAAAGAGLKAGDVILSYAGQELTSADRLKELVAANDKVKSNPLVVWREGEAGPATKDVPPGKLGVVLDPDPAPRAVAARRRSADHLVALARGGTWAELPGAAAELAGLRALVPDATVLARADAGPRRLAWLRGLGRLAGYRYLHFAAHGEANSVRAFESALVLHGGDAAVARLTAREVLDTWRLDADLVTLSACETAVGRDGGGDGLLGFAQAFLTAGARSVCLSLWKVDDAATALLMDRFYRNLLGKRDGLDRPLGKAAALAEAKRWLRELPAGAAAERLAALAGGASRGAGEKPLALVQPRPPAAAGGADRPFAHPRYWAAFVLIGDPG